MAKYLRLLSGTQHECRQFPWAPFQCANLCFPSLTLILCGPGRPWALSDGDHHLLTGSMVTSVVGPWLLLELCGFSIMQIMPKHSLVSRRSWFTVVVWGDILYISFTALLLLFLIQVFTVTYCCGWEERGAHLNKLWDLTSQCSSSLHRDSSTLFWNPHFLFFILVFLMVLMIFCNS